MVPVNFQHRQNLRVRESDISVVLAQAAEKREVPPTSVEFVESWHSKRSGWLAMRSHTRSLSDAPVFFVAYEQGANSATIYY